MTGKPNPATELVCLHCEKFTFGEMHMICTKCLVPLLEALKFYAERENWYPQAHENGLGEKGSECMQDKGDTARRVLHI